MEDQFSTGLLRSDESVRGIYGFDASLIYLADHKNRKLDCCAWIGCDGANFSYGFDEQSLASEVFRHGDGLWIEDPLESDIVSKVGVERFNINSSLIGVPLKHRRQTVGVLVLWHRRIADFAKPSHITNLEPFAKLAAAHIVLSEAARYQDEARRGFQKLQEQMQTEVSVEKNLEALMKAVQDAGFDRVRVFEYHPTSREFKCRAALGAENDVRGVVIPIHENQYARDTIDTACSEPVARVYDPSEARWGGPDPHAKVLGKPDNLPWAVVPLVIAGEVCGQIAADNARTGGEIRKDSLNYMTLLGALAAQAISTERILDVARARALPLLYDRLAVDDPRQTVTRRILVYATSGDSMGFSRAILFEPANGGNQLKFSCCMGSPDAKRHEYVTRKAKELGIQRLLEGVDDIKDDELATAVREVTVDTVDEITSAIIQDGHANVREFSPANWQDWPQWLCDLAKRIDADHLLLAPVKDGSEFFGLLVLDRRWQDRGINEDDRAVVRLTARHAAQILRQHRLQQQVLETRDLHALGFIAKGLAHQLRQPIGELRADSGNLVENVKRKEFDQAQRTAERIGESVDQLVEAVRALEALLRPDEHMMQTDIREIFNNVLKLCGRRAENHGIDFRVSVDDNVTLILAIPRLLVQALINLIANAQHAVEDTGTNNGVIELNARMSDNRVTVRVNDNGPGIPPEVLEQVLRPGSVYTSDPRKGLGIGLEIVRRVAEVHHGGIDVRSIVGQGTTVEFWIPVAH